MSFCYNCGKPNKDSLGLCPACVEQKSNQRQFVEQDNFTTSRFKNNRNNQAQPPVLANAVINFLIFIFGSLAIVFVLYVVWNKVLIYQYYESKFGDFVVEDSLKKSMFKFKYQEPSAIKGYVLDYAKLSGNVSDGGMILQLHYLNEAAYEIFKRKYKDTKHCPAWFYNNNIKHVALLASSSICKSKLLAKNYDNWGSFNISGKYARFDEGYNEKGKAGFPSGDYRFFVVEGCS